MGMTLSIQDPLAREFRGAVPARRRSRLVTDLIERESAERNGVLGKASHAANADAALERGIDQWQAVDDGFEK